MNTLHEYNGYTNKPTWLVSLWIDNDEYDQKEVLRVATDCVEYTEDPVYEMALYLENLHDTWKSDNIPNVTVFSDLLTFTLAYVNWRELAEMYIEQVMEEV